MEKKICSYELLFAISGNLSEEDYKTLCDKFVNLIKKYTVIDQLDAAILNELIDKIVVHHKEIAEDGRVFQQVEIYYRFIGKLEHAVESEKVA